MEYAVTPKLVDPTNIPHDLYGLQRYAGSRLFIDSTLILCSAVCYATLTPLMVRLSILPRIKSVSARNCNCIIPMEVCCLKWFRSPGDPECQSAMDYLLTGNINWSWPYPAYFLLAMYPMRWLDRHSSLKNEPELTFCPPCPMYCIRNVQENQNMHSAHNLYGGK